MSLRSSNNSDYIHELEDAISTYERAIGHFATRTRQMIERYGNIGALEALMTSADLQQGFKVLRDKKMLNKSFESIIIKHKDAINFKESAVKMAQFRLDHPYWDKGL